ncbi:MAG: zf-HC2 domain-containing protein [Acidobacteriota bacterium]|nr:MAG: zf-HC2 domain-containing protein [Acidobacteriota bacterium]
MNTPERDINKECARKEDLIGYLYDELSVDERVSFERHLAGCASCDDEVRAFGRVRDDLSTWQVGFVPRTSFEAPRGRWDVFLELVGMFPVWARGAALISAALLIASISFGVSQMVTSSGKTADPAISAAEVEAIIAKERLKLREDLRTEMAGFKEQINAEHEARLETVKAEHETRIKSLQAGFQSEIRKVNRQNSSIRSFFAMDDSQDPWGGTR